MIYRLIRSIRLLVVLDESLEATLFSSNFLLEDLLPKKDDEEVFLLFEDDEEEDFLG